MNRFVLSSTTALTLIWSTAGLAQTTAPAPSAAQPPLAAGDDGTADPQAEQAGLTDIVVTAQRRSESLQRAAIAVSAVSGDLLSSAGVTRPTELTALVPALQVAPSAGPYTLFYLRGVGNFNGNALSDSAIAFNFDGVYVGRPSGTTGFFYDVDRVEVLKGPQGTLYGRNATGGAINVLSRRPELGTIGGYVTGEYGNYDAARVEGALNIPLGDQAALRIAGTAVRHDGYMRDGTDDQRDAGGRVSLRVEPDDNVSINIVADYFRQRGIGVGGTPVELGVKDRPGFLSPSGQAFTAREPNLTLGRALAPFTVAPFMRNSQWGLSATIDWRTPIGTVTLTPAHRENYLNFRSETAGFYLWQRERDEQNSVELRLASGDAHPIRYLLGAFYYNEINKVPYFYINQQSNVNLDSYRQSDDSKALFGRLTWAPVDPVRLTAGVRYTNEVKDLNGQLLGAVRICTRPTAYFPTYVPGCQSAQPFPVALTVPAPNFNPLADGTLTLPVVVDATGPRSRRLSVDRVTYRLGADWDVTARNLLYASYETGFKSGGFFFSADAGVYHPERIEAWTIGSKNRFLDNRLQLNLEGFYWRYRDQQISHLVADSAGNVIFATENVGRATYKGVEADARLLLTPTTELNADVQYLDARYKAFQYQTPNQNGGLSNGTSCPNVGTPGTSYTVDCSGKRPPYAPVWTINLGVRQTIMLPHDNKIVLGVRGHHQTRTLTGLEFTVSEYQKAYWQLDGEVNLQLRGGITIGGYVNNATDTTVVANTFPVPLSVFTAASLRPPRTYGARATITF
ncbi:MAG: TonB-dependent receptor [Sphingomonas sp.]|nr:MAG: TonB-dependent receptor [Sphingomonas sp.]